VSHERFLEGRKSQLGRIIDFLSEREQQTRESLGAHQRDIHAGNVNSAAISSHSSPQMRHQSSETHHFSPECIISGVGSMNVGNNATSTFSTNDNEAVIRISDLMSFLRREELSIEEEVHHGSRQQERRAPGEGVRGNLAHQDDNGQRHVGQERQQSEALGKHEERNHQDSTATQNSPQQHTAQPSSSHHSVTAAAVEDEDADQCMDSEEDSSQGATCSSSGHALSSTSPTQKHALHLNFDHQHISEKKPFVFQPALDFDPLRFTTEMFQPRDSNYGFSGGISPQNSGARRGRSTGHHRSASSFNHYSFSSHTNTQQEHQDHGLSFSANSTNNGSTTSATNVSGKRSFDMMRANQNPFSFASSWGVDSAEPCRKRSRKHEDSSMDGNTNNNLGDAGTRTCTFGGAPRPI